MFTFLSIKVKFVIMHIRIERRGFTLIEVLTVVAVISLLIVLLIPAVLSARQSALKSQCANNLRQIGIAIEGYNNLNQTFPQGADAQAFSAHAVLLLHLEQVQLYNSINFSIETSSWVGLNHPNGTVAATRVSVFLCPSNYTVTSATIQDLGTQERTSYACNGGYVKTSQSFNGVFVDRTIPLSARNITPNSVVDGLTETAAMSEWVLAEKKAGLGDRLSSTFDLGANSTLSLPSLANACQQVSITTMDSNASKTCFWIRGGYGSNIMNFILTPFNNTCSVDGTIADGAITASSRHGSQVNVLFLDGHVKPIDQSVNLNVWRSISTRSGSEVIDSL